MRILKTSKLLQTSLLSLLLASGCQTPSSTQNDIRTSGLTAPVSCGSYQQSALQEPDTISAQNGQLQTVFVVKSEAKCAPFWNGSAWTLQSMTLRNYGYNTVPVDLNQPTDVDAMINNGTIKWSYPGATLRLNKATTAQGTGDRLRMRLYNRLTPNIDVGCLAPTNSTTPNCFHGNEITNMHFHGSHVSPQPHQDYVLLKLYPQGSTGINRFGPNGQLNPAVAIDQYDINVDPLLYEQPDGTHWYHAHKHGSTAIQILNGMAGALIVEGPFDTWLNDYYSNQGQTLTERLLVIQQISDILPMLVDRKAPGTAVPPGAPLVNGQGDPMLTMRPGEIQRWRIVNATMQASTQLLANLPKGFTVKQIAMDGIQFGPVNYADQPLQTTSAAGSPQFTLSPGNRLDLLVQAPATSGTFKVRQKNIGNLAHNVTKSIQTKLAAAATPNLFTVSVNSGSNAGMTMPTTWPALPPYLAYDSIPAPTKSKTVTYGVSQAVNPPPTGSINPRIFSINGEQYKKNCVNAEFTTQLDTSEQWTVSNVVTSGGQNTYGATMAHPFHIHTNPFLVYRNGSTTYKAPIWQDTIALPINGTDETSSSVELKLHFTDFTGEYVQHCHFLGHEDLGMMTNVQTICPNNSVLSFGRPTTSTAECVAGNFIPAAMICR